MNLDSVKRIEQLRDIGLNGNDFIRIDRGRQSLQILDARVPRDMNDLEIDAQSVEDGPSSLDMFIHGSSGLGIVLDGPSTNNTSR
jgi:hypothetical protein